MQIRQHNTHNTFETLFPSVLKHGAAICKNTFVCIIIGKHVQWSLIQNSEDKSPAMQREALFPVFLFPSWVPHLSMRALCEADIPLIFLCTHSPTHTSEE